MSLLELIAPFHAIANELKIIRELYEADLASRESPIIRVTEEPKKDDTMVMYGTEDEDKVSLLTKMKRAWNTEE